MGVVLLLSSLWENPIQCTLGFFIREKPRSRAAAPTAITAASRSFPQRSRANPYDPYDPYALAARTPRANHGVRAGGGVFSMGSPPMPPMVPMLSGLTFNESRGGG